MGGRKILDKKAGIELTEQQRRFCKYYVRCLNGSEAYKLAYDLSEDSESARVSASRLLTNDNIIDYIDYLRSDIEEALDLSKLKVVAEHQKMAFSSIARLHNTWITRKEFELLTEEEKACIQEISTKTQKLYNSFTDKKTGISVKEEEGEEVWVKVKLYDKQKSLESISKMLGYDAPTKISLTGDELKPKEEFLAKIRKATKE